MCADGRVSQTGDSCPPLPQDGQLSELQVGCRLRSGGPLLSHLAGAPFISVVAAFGRSPPVADLRWLSPSWRCRPPPAHAQGPWSLEPESQPPTTPLTPPQPVDGASAAGAGPSGEPICRCSCILELPGSWCAPLARSPPDAQTPCRPHRNCRIVTRDLCITRPSYRRAPKPTCPIIASTTTRPPARRVTQVASPTCLSAYLAVTAPVPSLFCSFSRAPERDPIWPQAAGPARPCAHTDPRRRPAQLSSRVATYTVATLREP